MHVQKDRDMFYTLTQGSGDTRRQPLTFIITTAGTNRNSIGWEMHQYAEDILRGKKIDPTFYPLIYSAPEDADWMDEEVWKKANPSLGITWPIERLRTLFEQAKDNPARENTFRQLRLNQWVKQTSRWMPMHIWDQCNFSVDPEALAGRECYGGLDLATTQDVTAFVLVFPPEDEDDKYQLLPYFWVPEDTLARRVLQDHVPYDVWQKQGSIFTTEGNVVHYGRIEETIIKLGEKYNIREIAADPWNATQMLQNLKDYGFEVIDFRQGVKSLSPPSKELMRLVLSKKIAHGGNPPLRWMFDNIEVRTDEAENIRPDKKHSTERIDGAIATIMALDRATRQESRKRRYADKGMLVIDLSHPDFLNLLPRKPAL